MLSCGELILLSNMLDNPTLIKLGQLFLKFRDSLVDPISPYSNDRNKSFGPQFFNIFIRFARHNCRFRLLIDGIRKVREADKDLAKCWMYPICLR